MSPLRLLIFSTLFPNGQQPNHGIFVENRLRHLVATGHATATILAPVPYFPSDNSRFGPWARYARWAEALPRVRISQPASGNAARASSASAVAARSSAAPSGSLTR